MSQGFLLCGQPWDEICHVEVKIWPFVLVLTQPLFVSLLGFLYNILHSSSSTYQIFSFIWRLSVVQSGNISRFWIFYRYFLSTECSCCPLHGEWSSCPQGQLTTIQKPLKIRLYVFPQSLLVGVAPCSSDTADLSQCIHLKACLGSQCCSAKHKYITLHFT